MDLLIKQGEAKTLNLTVTENGNLVDLSGKTLSFGVRPKYRITPIISKQDSDFGKDDAINGQVSVFLTAQETNQQPGEYVGELNIQSPGSPTVILKSQDIVIVIQQATT